MSDESVESSFAASLGEAIGLPKPRGVRVSHRRPRGYSGAGPDQRDPQAVGGMLNKLIKDRGWHRPTAEAKIFANWPVVVGPEIADHCRPVRIEGTELTLEAESTAWATQLRGMAGKILGRIATELGPRMVTRLRIHGPAAPSWVHGPWRVRGLGPRDTYG